MRSISVSLLSGLAALFSVCASEGPAAEPGSSRGEAPSTAVVHSQLSFTLASEQVQISVTERGGHMAPVRFYADSAHPIEPYHITPWQDEPPTEMPAPVLYSLRGDFFCLPFGGNSEPVNGEKHPPHGEIAGARWQALPQAGKPGPSGVRSLVMEFQTQVRSGKVRKELLLKPGHNVVYSRHTIDGFAGRVPLGHHATLAMPEEEGSVQLASSPIQFGITNPGVFSDPKNREYQSLLPGAQWTDLTKVPALAKNAPDADLTRMPARYGYADLVQLVNDPTVSGPAWITATFTQRGYVWFALKNPKQLVSTIFWIENHGRHGHPWNGRNHCLGIEDVTSHFADGLAASLAENVLNKQGVPTTIELKADAPTTVNYIQGVARVPAGFHCVKSIQFGKEQLTLTSTTGQSVTVPVQHEFLTTGQLN